MVALELKHYAEAKQYCRQGLSVCQQAGEQYALTFCLHTLGDIACVQRPKMYPESEAYFHEALAVARQVQVVPATLHALVSLAGLYAKRSAAEHKADKRPDFYGLDRRLAQSRVGLFSLPPRAAGAARTSVLK